MNLSTDYRAYRVAVVGVTKDAHGTETPEYGIQAYNFNTGASMEWLNLSRFGVHENITNAQTANIALLKVLAKKICPS